jgi:hypothetical protein
MKRMLDLCCGRFGWAKSFAERGWRCIGIDLTEPPETPQGCEFHRMDVLAITPDMVKAIDVDFICASTPCEEFAKFGLKMFHPDPPYPASGVRLFNHARELCEASGTPYVMENVQSAQQFVGKAITHCGPFYLWGPGVPHVLQLGLFGQDSKVPSPMPKGIKKGIRIGSGGKIKGMTAEERRSWRKQFPALQCSGTGAKRKAMTAGWATIPPELANCIVD